MLQCLTYLLMEMLLRQRSETLVKVFAMVKCGAIMLQVWLGGNIWRRPVISLRLQLRGVIVILQLLPLLMADPTIEF